MRSAACERRPRPHAGRVRAARPRVLRFRAARPHARWLRAGAARPWTAGPEVTGRGAHGGGPAGRAAARRAAAGRGTVLAVVALALALAAGGCADPVRKVSESSLRNATATDATDELRGLGYTVRDMRCRTLSADRISVIRVTCAGRASHGEPVRVDAVAYQAGSAHPRQEYVITVAGREVVRRPCLAQSCRDRS